MNLGVLECFFGPAWTFDDRKAWASFLRYHQLGFYLYGPKSDPHLRKKWQELWSKDYVAELKTLSETFRNEKVGFGIALSPFGVQSLREAKTKDTLREKIRLLTDVGIDYLGIFFDDMHAFPGLLDLQLEVLQIAQNETTAKILFCPTYYTFDPILDKVFGARPATYLEDLGRQLPQSIDVFWTGPKVISDEISAEHLREVAQLLKRKPFLFDNFFANDGPKNCKFLKLKSLSGRSPEAFREATGWAFNPMNQSALSQAVVLAASWIMRGKKDPVAALSEALDELSSRSIATMLMQNREILLKTGLDNLTSVQKKRISEPLCLENPIADELRAWLAGAYDVGSECLTD